MKRTLCFALIAFLGFVAAASGSTQTDDPAINRTTGKADATDLPQQLPMPKNGTDGQILWDLTHGIYLGYSPDNRYTDLVAALAGSGYTVTTTADIDHCVLDGFQMVVVCVASAWDSPYTDSERLRIKTFVDNGGGLLILGDHSAIPVSNINPVAQDFGITMGTSQKNDEIISNLAAHEIFDNVSELSFIIFGELAVSSPAQAVAWDGLGNPCIAVSQSGFGKVVAVGDVNFCENQYISQKDNLVFSTNVFQWLCKTTGGMTGKFDFNDGTTQGWTQAGAYNDIGGGPLASNFFSGWKDDVNYPNPPGGDPAGDPNGSFYLFTMGGHGVNSPGASWWLMQLCSPDLSNWETWQYATGYTVKLAECMASLTTLYANLYVTVYDWSQNKDRYFYNGDAQALVHDVYGDGNADWNTLTFDWSGIPTFPVYYNVRNIFIDLWGEMGGYFEGGVYLDEVKTIGGTGVEDKPGTEPSGFSLSDNYPNPFNPATTIAYRLPADADVTMTIYDVRGTKVRTLVRENASGGSHTVLWDGKDDVGRPVASGIYVYRFEARTREVAFSDSKKMMLLK